MQYARDIYYSPTVSGLNIPADLAPKLVLGADVNKLVDFDWDHVIAQQAAWTTRFNREIAG
jgi:putative spermidine/putrescine transport system substrate-binding protein